MKKVKNKTHVVVTGGCGFIGSAFLRKYVPEYPEIEFINVDDMRAGSNEEAVEFLQEYDNYHFHKIALEEPTALWDLFALYPITDIIHFAADSDVDHSIKNPLYTANVNIMGTLLLLEAARIAENFNRFVYVSTDEVYGSVSEGMSSRVEDDEHHCSSPYSASKSAAEQFVNAYNKTYGIDTVITRGANTFGPWQDFTKLIPVAVKHLKGGKKIPLYGNGLQQREWLPVEMHAEGIYTAWQCGASGEAYNISTNILYTNVEMANLLIATLKAPKSSIEFVDDRPGHDQKYSINNEKIRRLMWPSIGSHLSKAYIDRKLVSTALWYDKYTEAVDNERDIT
jgi:dTDP-glucose 4,6-dehydratase